MIQNYTGHSDHVYALESINADSMASGSLDQTIQIWSISSGQTLRTINTPSGVISLLLLNNGFSLASGLNNGQIYIYNINNGNLGSSYIAHSGSVWDLLMLGSDLLASSGGNTILVRNLTTNTNKLNLNGHSARVNRIKLVSLNTLASSSGDNTIKLWNLKDGTLIRNLTNHTDDICRSIEVLSDGKTFVSGSYDKRIIFWNITTGEIITSINTGLTIRALTVLNLSSYGKYLTFYSKLDTV